MKAARNSNLSLVPNEELDTDFESKQTEPTSEENPKDLIERFKSMKNEAFTLAQTMSKRDVLAYIKDKYGILNELEKAEIKKTMAEVSFVSKSSKVEKLTMQRRILDDSLEGRVFVYREDGTSSCFKINDNNECSSLKNEELDMMIMKIFEDTAYDMTASPAKELRKTWIAKTRLIKTELPPLVVFQENNELAFKRLEFSINNEQDCPIFKKIFMDRASNSRAMAAFLWALFEEKCGIQQYLYLYGEGGDGKGTLIRLLQDHIFGKKGCAALQAEGSNLNEVPSRIVGKRLGVFNDLNNTYLPMTSIFKQITGGDSITVRNLYTDGFTYKPNTLLIITSNKRPSVTAQKSDIRRCIYCEFSPLAEEDAVDNIEEELIKEIPGILALCRKYYMELYDSKKKEIKNDKEGIEDAGEAFEMPLELIFDKSIELNAKGSVRKMDLFDRIKDSLKKDGLSFEGFMDYLDRKYKIKANRPTVNGVKSSSMIIKGIILKDINW